MVVIIRVYMYVHLHVHSILLLSPFLRLSLLSLFLSLMLVCYTHILHVHCRYCHTGAIHMRGKSSENTGTL